MIPLSDLFTRCPYCRGTTTMAGEMKSGRKVLFSECETCGARWDLSGQPIRERQVEPLPLVHGLDLVATHTAGALQEGNLKGQEALKRRHLHVTKTSHPGVANF